MCSINAKLYLWVDIKPRILEFSLVFNAIHPIMEKSGPYCFIDVGPP
jgi:hypothetical protein